MRSRQILISVAAIAALALGGSAAAVAAPGHHAAASVVVKEKEFKLVFVNRTLKHGVKYTFTAMNVGHLHHSLLVDGKGVSDHGIHNANAVAPGKSRSFTIVFPRAGTFRLYCAIPTHAQRGMQAKLKVT